MNIESVAMRRFREAEIAPLVRILTANGQYDFPEVEGPEAMRRVGLCSAAVFLCAEIDNKVAGCIRATYDGARAIIHLLSVDPQFQNQNIGAPWYVLLARNSNTAMHPRSPCLLQKTHSLIGKASTLSCCLYF